MNILDPQGPIAAAEKTILVNSLAIMLVIVLPTIVAILGFAIWFRASNTRAVYRPAWAYSGQIELVVWAIPALTVLLLSGVAWLGAHQLDPARPIEGTQHPLRIQVVSLDWKWLFIYPEQKIATINHLTVPAGAPLQFELTSSSVMNAFFIPQFGSMIYTMNGMVSRLNLRADHAGAFKGLSTHFSGDGFSGMQFDVDVVQPDRFERWVESSAACGKVIDETEYRRLAHPSMAARPDSYRLGADDLFQLIANQKLPPAPGVQAGAKGVSSASGDPDAR